MRVLISKESKIKLLKILKKKHKVSFLTELGEKMRVPKKTLDSWFYDKKRYIPLKIIPKEMMPEILEKKEDNWGNILGGKKTYQIIIEKYGSEELKRRQSLGGKKAIEKIRVKMYSPIPSLSDKRFLEFYGVLLGDGWIGKYTHKNKIIRLIGISGHSKLDRDFFHYLRRNINDLFNRRAYLKEKPKYNGIELQFSSLSLFDYISKDLGFPVGKKIDLRINKRILDLGYDNLRHLIRGIFDTDGSFFLDKTPVGRPYPSISIEMKAPILIQQLYKILDKEGFKVYFRNKHRDGRSRITLKGTKQLFKWMEEIGSSNLKHLDKINKFRSGSSAG